MSSQQKSYDTAVPGPCGLWPVDLKLTHLDWNPEATLIHFQGHYLTICELDYNILQGEIQNAPKSQAVIDIGEFCLVEDLTSARWYRGRVQNQKKDMCDVFLIDHGNVLSVAEAHISSCSNDLFILPPKIVCGFLSSVLLLPGCCHKVVEQYLANLIGKNVSGHIQALLPHKVVLLEAPEINSDLVHHGFARHVDTDTFLLLVEMLTEVPLKQKVEPAPDLLIEKQRVQEFYLKPKSLKGFEDLLSSCRPRLKNGTHMTVRVTAAVNPGLLYCQMTEKESELKEMSRKLAAVCELKTKINQLKTPDNLGLLCSVKSKDQKWYRGLVQHLPINSFVRVLFVDYGYFESVKIENIHRLPPDFCSTPIMGFPCALTCMDNEEEAAFKSKQLSLLKMSLLGGILEVEINTYKPEQHLYNITIMKVKERVSLAPVQKPTGTKTSRTESEKEPSVPMSGHMYYETVMSKELDKTLIDEEIRVDLSFTGYVEYVLNPNKFWVRSKKRNEEFETMMKKLSEHFNKVALDEDVLENPEPGMLCCAVFEEDMHFYRGVVVDILQHGAEVLFIDFGNLAKVPHNLIKKIPKEFSGTSAFALCCSLDSVVPTDEFWTSSSTNAFRNLSSNKILQVQVIQMRKNKLDVELYYEKSGNDGGQRLSELLISKNHAHYVKNVSEHYIEQNNHKSFKKASKHNQPLLNSKTLQNWIRDTEKSTDEQDQPKEPVRLNALNIKPGCEFVVSCPFINSPSNFWCQRLDQVPALEALMSRLQEYYATRTVPLEPQMLCCAVKSPHNEKWCRGIITKRQNGKATVVLADFGPCFEVSEEHLQGLRLEFCAFEGQAFRCSLFNVIEPLGLCWSKEATEFLRKFVDESGGALKCSVISQLNAHNKGLCHVVHICNTESNQNVSNLLVKNSLAQVVTRTAFETIVPHSFVYSSHNLTEGTEVQVYVTHVNNHLEIFCQLESSEAVLEELDAKISDVLKGEQANAETVVPKLCIAKYFDGMWYRGVTYSAQSPSHVSVFFVDYGNTMIAENKYVVSIPKDSVELLNRPMQAIQFSLARVPQDRMHADVQDWLDGAVLNKCMRVVIEAKAENGSFEVEMFDGDENINDRLKELIYSLTPKPKIAGIFSCSKKRHLNRPGNSQHKTNKNYNKNSQKINWNHKKSTTIRQNKQTGRVEYQQTKKSISVTNSAEAKEWPSPQEPQTNSFKEVVKESENMCQTENPVVFHISSLRTIEISEGSKLKCFITYIESESCFFLQRSDDEENVIQLENSMNSEVFKESLLPCTDIALKVGDLVLATYEEDEALYRAVVKEIVDPCAFLVVFVDFGNSATVSKEKLFMMKKDNITQPRYSVQCCLHDHSAFDSSTAFANAVMDRSLMFEFVCYKNSQWEVNVETFDAVTSVPDDAVDKMETNTVEPAASKEIRVRAKKETTIEVPEDLFKAFLPPKIQRGDTETGQVLSSQRNGEFYFRPDKSRDALAALETLIAVHLGKCEPIAIINVKEGLNCLAQEQKGGPWRRAFVKESSNDECLVHLLDHGKFESLSKHSLRQTLPHLALIPPFAVCCKMKFQGGSERQRHLCYQALKNIEGNQVKVTFVDISEDLWSVGIVMDRSLGQNFPNEEKQTELVFTQEHAPGLDLPQNLAFAPVELNKEYSGFAAAITSPCEFCLVLDDFDLISQVSILLDDLPNDLQPLPQSHLVPRTGCLVNSQSRNKWCRAEILHADSTLTLNLVDYGHAECLHFGEKSKLRKLPESITALPKVTYPCVLNAVRPTGEGQEWSDEATIFFQQCLDQRNLQIFFREVMSDQQWKVDVLTDGGHVAMQLVDAGHASYTDPMLGLRFQEKGLPGQWNLSDDEEDDEDPDDVHQMFEETEEIFKVKSDSNLCTTM
ncbi:unnamed protein product [Knipowitschia caucasica]